MNTSLFIPKNATQFFIDGPQGKLDCLLTNSPQYLGIAIIFHPDPKEGGTNTNKVVQSIAKCLNQRGYLCVCPNLRGVGLSDGIHDNGKGEVADAKAIYAYLMNKYNQNNQYPVILAGFSFGTAIASQLADQVPHQKLILVGAAITRYRVVIPNPDKTMVIHGAEDEIIPIKEIFSWSKANLQEIVWVPDTGHFFHGKLHLLHRIINNINLSE